MSVLGNAIKMVFRGGEAKAFGFIADLAWQMLKAQRTNLPGKQKLDLVLQWFAKVFSNTFGPKYEELRAAVIELIAAGKKVANLIKALG